MKKITAALLLFLLAISASMACLNYYYSIDNEGHFHEADEILVGFNKNFNKESIETKLIKLEAKISKQKEKSASENSYGHLSDYAVYLMKAGKTKEALELLITLYYHHPDEYRIASNLGTAYELNGQVDSALKYIKRGLVLNPDDHEGSEWIHVKVLEAKLALAKDPLWLNNNTVLQLTEKQEHDLKTGRQIDIQVRERFPFTPGPDAIMASLLTDLGDCYANTASIEFAKVVYQIAKEYYGDKSTALDTKIKDLQKLIKKYETVYPESNKYSDGKSMKLKALTMKQLMDDNDKQHYQIKWEKVNTDVKALLVLANVEPVPVKNTIAKSDSAITASKENTNEIENNEKPFDAKLLAAIGIALLGLLVWLFYRNMKDKKDFEKNMNDPNREPEKHRDEEKM